MRRNYIIPLLLVALGFNIGIALAAFAPRAYLPFVATGAVETKITTLVTDDTSFVTAEVIPNTCRVIVSYINRSDGNRLHVTEDIGTSLREIPLPPGITGLSLTPQRTNPQFQIPGPKQAFGDTVFACGVMKEYVTSRDPGDETGPFRLKRIDMPIP